MSPTQGDILLLGSNDRGFQLLDAVTQEPLAGSMALDDAIDIALSMTSGAVWQQKADSSGRAVGPLVQLICKATDRPSGVRQL